MALIPSTRLFWNLWEILTLISFSMIAPGLLAYIVYYIKKITAKFETAKIFGRYHIHEGFVGAIFLLIGIILLFLRSTFLYLRDPLYAGLSFILLSTQVFSFIFIYLGSFFFFRDWHDVIHLKFIEIIQSSEKQVPNNSISVFNNISNEDLLFFQFPKWILYPIGMIITMFSINLVIYGIELFPKQLTDLDEEFLIHLGYLSCSIAGGMIGIDWLRLFKKFYPELYKDIEIKIDQLKNQD